MNSATLERAAVEARPRLVAIAYRMLGSMSDAEDAVQDALRCSPRTPPTSPTAAGSRSRCIVSARDLLGAYAGAHMAAAEE